MSAAVEITTLIHASAETVFDLEVDVDAHTASMKDSGETATTRSGKRHLVLGDEVTFTARHFGRRWVMTSRVTEYERPRRFVDEQTEGPFRRMRHEHLFEEVAGVTRMTDRMTATLPLGPVGVLAARVVLQPYLRLLLSHRARHVKALAETVASS